jgi:ankyrin repeat protein
LFPATYLFPQAAHEGDTSSLQYLLDSSYPNLVDNEGRTVAHIAAYTNTQMALERILVANDVGLDQVDIRGATPLHLAAFTGSVDSLRHLLARKANVNAQDHDSLTPLDYSMVRSQCTSRKS